MVFDYFFLGQEPLHLNWHSGRDGAFWGGLRSEQFNVASAVLEAPGNLPDPQRSLWLYWEYHTREGDNKSLQICLQREDHSHILENRATFMKTLYMRRDLKDSQGKYKGSVSAS